jgi:gliding motility-associated-like protein
VDSVLVTVLPGVQAMLEADTTVLCEGASVHLTASGGVGNATYFWWPSTGINGSGTQVLASPVENTEYRVIVSEGRCRDTASVLLMVHPAPHAGFTMSQPEGCKEVSVKFNDLSSNSLTHIWDFGDGSAYNNQVNPGHVYTESGNYTVRLIVQGIGGCRDTLESSLPIALREGVVADIFSDPVAPVELVMPMSEIRLEERNSRATEWKWSFGDGGHAEGKAVRHTYKLPGTYYVDVEVSDAEGCRELRRIGPYIVKEEVMDIPNVFSPNGDGLNDIFRVSYDGDELFMLEIYDRWGVKYHESRNKEQGWDGRDLNGKESAVGVYFYTVKAGAREYQGSITLLR